MAVALRVLDANVETVNAEGASKHKVLLASRSIVSTAG
jgi:hypothetical protein